MIDLTRTFDLDAVAAARAIVQRTGEEWGATVGVPAADYAAVAVRRLADADLLEAWLFASTWAAIEHADDPLFGMGV